MSQVKRTLVHDSKAVTQGAILSFNIPSFETIDDIIIKFTNNGAPATKSNILSSIGKVALSINGEQVINAPLSELYAVYESLGNEVTQNLANCIGLNTGRYLFKDPTTEDFFAWGCEDIQVIQLQVYVNATVTDVTDLEVVTVRRKMIKKLGSFIKIITYPQTFASTGISTVDTLPRDSNEAYLSVLAFNGGGVIGSGECVVNGNNIMDNIGLDLNNYIVSARGLGVVNNAFNYSFSDGSLKGILPMQGVTELRLKTTFTTAPSNGVYDLCAVSIRNVPLAMLQAVAS